MGPILTLKSGKDVRTAAVALYCTRV